MKQRRPPAPRPGIPVREAALELLLALEAEGFPATERLDRDEARFTREEDRRLFRALVLETLRHRGRLDRSLGALLKKTPLDRLEPPVRNLLRLGATQLLVLERIGAHAAVDTSVALARRYGHEGTAALVNAVLRRLAREGEPAPAPSADPLVELAARHSVPEWLARRWVSRWGFERAERALAWSQTHPDYWLRIPPGGEPPAGAQAGWIPGTARLGASGIRPIRHLLDEGRFAAQDGSAILVGLLAPEVRGRVLDLCAAPGTKTLHLAERAVPGTTIVALDRSLRRLAPLRSRVDRDASARSGGPGNGARVFVVAADSANLPLRGLFDGILLDAPCSNLGVLRRRVDLRHRVREEEIARLAGVQSALLDEAARCLAPGGWLVYSVCTPEPEEGPAQRDRFLSAHPECEPMPLPTHVPSTATLREGEYLLVPGEHETDGGYAFVVRRRMSTRGA